jgi:hypothetical protein
MNSVKLYLYIEFNFFNVPRVIWIVAPLFESGLYIYLYWSSFYCKSFDYTKEVLITELFYLVSFRDLINVWFYKIFPEDYANYCNNFYSS